MRNILTLGILCLMGLFHTTNGQDLALKEPDFVGEGLLINDTQAVSLEKNKVNIETRMYWSAVGLNIVVNGCCSNVSTKAGTVKLLVKVQDNSLSPSSSIEVFRLNSNAKNRIVEYMKLGNFGRMKEGTKMETLTFVGTKYGVSSYILTLQDVKPGEYGLVLESEKKNVGGGGALKSVVGPTSILCFSVK
ncbi:hypothetical protein [Aquirufa aurantiipilula]|uniref:hypothetical protein n=1 Tax=Aquirufa aurantiipilula TaxID=2696561 RepID=UPI001CAA5FCA|nr:hypothetical protein [Aquirufa aurantiipilula]MBZ1326552.1 hypothetical protein [Aquirufa aurantiipilula]